MSTVSRNSASLQGVQGRSSRIRERPLLPGVAAFVSYVQTWLPLWVFMNKFEMGILAFIIELLLKMKLYTALKTELIT